jgi:ATP-dependent Clp protease ATP-binding subunit ClpB
LAQTLLKGQIKPNAVVTVDAQEGQFVIGSASAH